VTIGNDFDNLIGKLGTAAGTLPPAADGKPRAPGVDPRLSSAVDDTAAQGRKARDAVADRGDKTDKYTKGLAGIQDRGGKDVNGAGDGSGTGSGSRGAGAGAAMPQMPQVPQRAAPATAAPMLPAPAGVSSIDPKVLAALIQAVRARSAAEAASGDSPHLGRDPNRLTAQGSATTPQDRQPLDVSEVSLEKYPAGTLSQDEVADVVDQALTINGIPNDPALREQWQELYQHMAQHESGNDPNAANDSDSNATGSVMDDGSHANSSRGMWQCVPSTFAAHHMAGTSNSIYDPVASAAASIDYVMTTYHVSPDGDGLSSFMDRQGVGTGTYRGY
jgi:hypothetical protein